MAKPTERFLRLQLEEQLRAMTAAERVVHADRDRLEKENCELRHELEKMDNEVLAEIAAKNEARQVAAGLLRLARTQTAALRKIDRIQSVMPEGDSAKAAYGALLALAALHPGVRKMVEEQ